jgi:putative flavoprotein involved in K+ transport
LVGHLGVLDEHGNPRGGFASHVGDGMFAIGYGIPPSGPLRAIRVNATPLARDVAVYLERIDPSVRAPLGCTPTDLVARRQRRRTFDSGVSLAMHAETARAKNKGVQ